MQLPLIFPDQYGFRCGNAEEALQYLKGMQFDIRRRKYESTNRYEERVLCTAFACSVNYYAKAIWMPIEECTYLCPTGHDNRLSRSSPQFGPDCYFLEMKHISAEDWQVPNSLDLQPVDKLPKRAVYVPKYGDVALSRFREPLGKCVVYLDNPCPLVLSNPSCYLAKVG